jgi:hypothetical protein
LTNAEPIVVLLAQCRPIEKSWKKLDHGECWPTQVRIYSIYVQVGMIRLQLHPRHIANFTTAYSVITDFICAFLPIAVLWKVKITLKTKIGVCCLMSLGLIATAVAIVRASSLGTKTADLSYDYCIAAIWANTELHLGIIATNLALSRMMWSHFFGSTLPHTHTPRYGTGSHLSRNTKNGYTKSSDRSDQGMYGKDLGMRVSVDNVSQTSQIPLDPIIKRTSVHISYGAASPNEGHGPDGAFANYHSEARRLDSKE